MKSGRNILATACLGLLCSAAAVSASDWPETQAQGRLRVLANGDEYPEMFNFDPGSGAGPGLERELLEMFCRANKITLEVLRVEDFTNEIPMLQRDEGDLIIGIVNTEPRRALVAFTPEVFPVRFFVGTHAKTPPVVTVMQLRERSVGVVVGSSWVDAAKKAGVPPQRLKIFENLPAMFDGLEKAQIGAVVMPVADLTLAIKRHPAVRVGIPLGDSMSGCWAVRKTSPLLKQKLDEFLATARAGNVWSRLVVKYYGDGAVEILKKAKD